MTLIKGQDYIAMARRLGITPTDVRLATAGFTRAVDLDPGRSPDLKAITLAELGVTATLSEHSCDRLWTILVQRALVLLLDDMAANERDLREAFAMMRAAGVDPAADEEIFASVPNAADLRPLVEAMAHV